MELEVLNNVPAAGSSVDALQASDPDGHARLGNGERVEQQLEPADGGAAAWKILCAAFMFEAVLFGKYSVRKETCMNILTHWIDSRLLGFIWCFPKLLYKALGIQGQPVYTCRRDNGVWHTISWWPSNGCLCEALSALSPTYRLDRLAVMYPGTGRRLFCEQPWLSDIYSRNHVWG